MIDFTAIDFETAQGKRWSACAVGLVRVENGIIVHVYKSLIRPPDNEYSYHNTLIHGIDSYMTITSPELPLVWKDIKNFIKGQLVIAHNMRFDADVLVKSLAYYDIETPGFRKDCTLDIYGCKLNDICRAYDILLDHHDPLSDARACAQLYLNHLNNVPPKHPVAASKPQRTYHERIGGDVLKPDLENADPNNYFYGQKVVITGVFKKVERKELAQMLKKGGADIDTSISKKTNIIVAGKGAGYKKMEKANDFIAKGHPLKIMGEEEFFDLI